MAETQKTFFQTNRDVLVFGVLAILVLCIYAQAAGFQFINFDDNFYVYENPAVTAGLTRETLRWAFTAFYAGNWHPLTWISLAADVQMFGVRPGMIHAINVLLHLIAAMLAFVVFRRMTGTFWPSAAIACLFAVHPAHVESVAWIAERKDVLSTVFWFASMWFYVGWARSGTTWRAASYFGALALFALGLMAKPMVITLPFVFLLCDIWPLERLDIREYKQLGRRMLEKIPFFVLAAVSAMVTIAAQRTADAVLSLTRLPLDARIKNSILSYAKYVLMMFFPSGLGVWYPYDDTIGTGSVILAALLLLTVTAVCIWQFRSRKYLLVGWLWFIGTLVPVIGLMQVGAQSMADRYTYIPYFGLFVMAVFGADELFTRLALDRRILLAAGTAVIVTLTYIAFVQTRYWHDNETLYTHTLAVTRNNFLIEQNLCGHLINLGRLDEAEQHCVASLATKPQYFPAQNGLGIIAFSRKDYPRAEAEFAKAVAISPQEIGPYSNLAQSQLAQGKANEAEATIARVSAVGSEADLAKNILPAMRGLVAAFAAQEDYQKVSDNLSRILYLAPDDVAARTALADTLLKLGRNDDAQFHIERVLAAGPASADAYNILGMALLNKRQMPEAATAFKQALRLRPNFVQAKENLVNADDLK